VDIAARFGDNLVRARKRADLSQDELGIRASLHRTEVSQLERGLRVPRIDTLVKLVASLDVPADELLDGIVWTPGSSWPGAFTAIEPTRER
jgi:transcriptional regulator with XRE-family HTH domain